MSDDLVKRLREGDCLENQIEAHGLTTEAADYIEKLENALLEIANGVGDLSAYWIARVALGKKDD